MSIVGDIMGVATGVQDYKHGKAARNVERAGLNTSMQAYGQLQTLMSDPSKITEMPMYKAGLEAVQRSLGQQGLTGSGNAVLDLSEYGGNFYQQQLATLISIARGGTPEFGSGGKVQAGGAGRISSILTGGNYRGDNGGGAGGGGGMTNMLSGGGGGGGMNGSAGNASVAMIG